jgi:predicted transcriptional regulator
LINIRGGIDKISFFIYPIIRRKKMTGMQRSRWEIILDILDVISDEGRRSKKTRIMKKAYLDWWSFEKYFAKLIERGFVEKIVNSIVGTIYALTEKGEDLQERMKEVRKILGGEK